MLPRTRGTTIRGLSCQPPTDSRPQATSTLFDLSFVLGEVMNSHCMCFSFRPDPYYVCYFMEYRFNPAEPRLLMWQIMISIGLNNLI